MPISWRSYLGAVSVLGIGVGVSLMSDNWQWFSRSGSIVVVIGILLTSHQLLENIRRLRNRQSKQNKSAMHDWAKDDPHYDLTRNHEEEAWATERSGFLLLIIGTLVWGLGDLLAYMF